MRYELTADSIFCHETGRAKPEAVYWVREDRAPGCGKYWALDYRRGDGWVGTVRTFLNQDALQAHMREVFERLTLRLAS